MSTVRMRVLQADRMRVWYEKALCRNATMGSAERAQCRNPYQGLDCRQTDRPKPGRKGMADVGRRQDTNWTPLAWG
jgi:hypothetical protein